jgi:hypothetical protein
VLGAAAFQMLNRERFAAAAVNQIADANVKALFFEAHAGCAGYPLVKRPINSANFHTRISFPATSGRTEGAR